MTPTTARTKAPHSSRTGGSNKRGRPRGGPIHIRRIERVEPSAQEYEEAVRALAELIGVWLYEQSSERGS